MRTRAVEIVQQRERGPGLVLISHAVVVDKIGIRKNVNPPDLAEHDRSARIGNERANLLAADCLKDMWRKEVKIGERRAWVGIAQRLAIGLLPSDPERR